MEEITNKDLMHYIADIKDDIKDIKENDLPEINGRVKTTNGSVAEIIKWKERVTGAMAVVLIVLLPILGWALFRLATENERFQNSMTQFYQEHVAGVNQ